MAKPLSRMACKDFLYWCSLCLLFFSVSLSGQTSLSSLKPNLDMASRLEVNKQFNGTGGSIDLSSSGGIGSLAISGSVQLHDARGYVRVLLKGSDGQEFLVLESNTLFSGGSLESFTGIGEETQHLKSVQGASLVIVAEKANITLSEIFITSALDSKSLKTSGLSALDLKKQQVMEKVNYLNARKKVSGQKWTAGITPVAMMSYEEKKKLFRGTVPNLNGAEYYKGGIFEMPGSTSSQTSVAGVAGNTSAYIDNFDWRNRHGQFWLTSVKDQGGCGSCWAFAATATTEQLVNLYFNRHLNMDLSEQDALSCSGAGTCAGGWPYATLDYIKTTGLVNESCFGYQAQDLPCANKCTSPTERVKIGGRIDFWMAYEDTLKSLIIKGPVSGGIYSWSHALNLVGYKVIQAGDVVNGYGTVPTTDPLIGRTMWIFKNSWSVNWGDAGYLYLVTDISDIGWTHGAVGPVTTPNYTTADIRCTDADGDGYYFWGLGAKPSHCPPCPAQADGDDSNPNLGPLDQFGYCLPIGVRYTLTTTAVNGSITLSPQGPYVPNAVVTATAVPNAGYAFLNWNGVATDVANPTTITMTSNKTLTANFKAVPVVAITSPSEGTRIITPSSVTFTASASFSAGTISKVDFYLIDNTNSNSPITTLLYSDNTSPYSYTKQLPIGVYQVKAVATSNTNLSTTSSLVSFRVTTQNAPPTVSIISPVNGTHHYPSDFFFISASATDNEGPIKKVEFLRNGLVFSVDSFYPGFDAGVQNIPVGTHSFTARAYDQDGASTLSAPISIIIDPSPCVVNYPVPSNQNWQIRNEWYDQQSGSILVNEGGDMKIVHRAYGQSMLWLLDNVTFPVVQGKTYKIEVDFYDDVNIRANSIEAGFSAGINMSGNAPLLTQAAVTIPGPFSNTGFTKKSVYITAAYTQQVSLALKINWGIQPNSQVVSYIRNISVCGQALAGEDADVNAANSSNSDATSALVLSPNPTEEVLNIRLAEGSISEVLVLNAAGVKVLSKNYSNDSNLSVALEVKELPSGIYYLMVKNNETVYKQLFIKR